MEKHMKNFTVMVLIACMLFSTLTPTYAQINASEQSDTIILGNGIQITKYELNQLLSNEESYILVSGPTENSFEMTEKYSLTQSYRTLSSGVTIPPNLRGAWEIYILGFGLVTVTLYSDMMKINDTIINAGDALWGTVIAAVDALAYQMLVNSIPSRFRNGNVVDLDKFNQRVRGQTRFKEKGGWQIDKNIGGNPHGGSKWKLKNEKGERKATLDENGEILRD